MIQATARKWGGSHEGMFEFARSVSAQAPDGHSGHKLVALAHIERWLDAPKDQRTAYFHDEAVQAEIRAAADRSVRSTLYVGGVVDPVDNPFAMCFYLMRDYDAQLEQMRLIGPHITAAPWHYQGTAGAGLRARPAAGVAGDGAVRRMIPAVECEQIDGVTVLRADLPVDRTLACLTFRVGRFDETLAASGITHTVEHLTLVDKTDAPYSFNANVNRQLHLLLPGKRQPVAREWVRGRRLPRAGD